MLFFLVQIGKPVIILLFSSLKLCSVAANGDVANKIGTYQISVLGGENNVPVYVVVPTSTIDLNIEKGEDIEIEERGANEVCEVGGHRTAPEGVSVFNPAFDITPNRYLSGIVTEEGTTFCLLYYHDNNV